MLKESGSLSHLPINFPIVLGKREPQRLYVDYRKQNICFGGGGGGRGHMVDQWLGRTKFISSSLHWT